jgi:hypothetical protein
MMMMIMMTIITIIEDLMNVTSLCLGEKRITLLQMFSCILPSSLHGSVCWILSERQLTTADWKHSLLVKNSGLTYIYIYKASVKRKLDNAFKNVWGNMTTRMKRSLAISVHTNTSKMARNKMFVDRSFT